MNEVYSIGSSSSSSDDFNLKRSSSSTVHSPASFLNLFHFLVFNSFSELMLENRDSYERCSFSSMHHSFLTNCHSFISFFVSCPFVDAIIFLFSSFNIHIVSDCPHSGAKNDMLGVRRPSLVRQMAFRQDSKEVRRYGSLQIVLNCLSFLFSIQH